MGFVENIKWWQWIAISLLVGAALGYINQAGFDAPAEHRSMEPMEFEYLLGRRPFGTGPTHVDWINDIIVYPARPAPKGTGQVQLVTFIAFLPVGTSTGNLPQLPPVQCFMYAPYPYEPQPRPDPQRGTKHPGTIIYHAKRGDTMESLEKQFYGKATPDGRAAIISANEEFRSAHSNADRQPSPANAYYIPWNPAANHSVNDFIDAAEKLWPSPSNHGNPIAYRYVWWQSPQYAMKIWMGGSFLVIGVIWPILLQMMLKGGLGRPETEEEYDLSRFKGGKTPQKKARPRTGLTAEDLAQMAAMEASLRASLGPMADGMATAPGAAAAPAATNAAPLPVKALKGDALATEVPKTEEQKSKEYRGEFYPVVKPLEQPKEKKDKSDKKE